MTSFNYTRLVSYAVITIGLLFTFSDAIEVIWARWHEDRYSHAPFVLSLALYLIWIKRHDLHNSNDKAWYGVLIVLISSLTLIIGELSAIWTIVQYSLFFLLFGLAWSMLGTQINKILIPFLHVLLVIPLPYMLDVMLSGKFQLMSSILGVDIIRALDIPVFRDGNIIDLGIYKLQVVEACSGLNYTYPLMTISLMMAYMYKAPFFARALVFLTSIPISIVMNSFRIAIVAVLVNLSGIEAAEGFMHYFEGGIIFFLCIAILLIEVKILNKVLKLNQSLSSSFDYLEEKHLHIEPTTNLKVTLAPIIASVILITLASLSTLSIHERNEITPDRESFSKYPLQMETWKGESYKFRNNENDILKLTDYFLADYQNQNKSINVYFGYAQSQRNDFVPHSPKACIPGGGWEISDANIYNLKLNNNNPFEITRLIISKGEYNVLVYYWFRQRGQNLSSEFPMKFALLKDSITKNRTDGALVRFTTPITGNIDEADQLLSEFISLNYPFMPDFIPD